MRKACEGTSFRDEQWVSQDLTRHCKIHTGKSMSKCSVENLWSMHSADHKGQIRRKVPVVDHQIVS